MAMRIKLKTSPELDEVARWRKTAFDKEFTEQELQRLLNKYGEDGLGVHYDDGVPTGQNEFYDGTLIAKAGNTGVKSGEVTTPQASFNPKTKYDTPIGIYYYPMAWAKDKIFTGGIPFAGDKRYVYVYRIKRPGKILDFSNFESGVFERVLYDAAKANKFDDVLLQSGISDSEILIELSNLFVPREHLAPVNSSSPEQNIRNVFISYLKKVPADELKEVFMQAFNSVVNYDKPYTFYFNWLAYNTSEFYSLKPGNKQLPTPGENGVAWEKAIATFLKEANIATNLELYFKNLSAYQKGPEINADFKKEIITSSIDKTVKRIKSYAFDIVLGSSRAALDPAAVKLPPPGSVAKVVLGSGLMDEQNLGKTFLYVINNFVDRKPARFTKYLVDLGYDGISDNKGAGAIHEKEPFQGVLFPTGGWELVGSYLNRFRAGREKKPTIGSKQLDPSNFLKKLIEPGAGKVVDKALEAISSDSEWTDRILSAILKNRDIRKDRALADKIINKVDLSGANLENLCTYIYHFVNVMDVDMMDERIGKFLDSNVRVQIENRVYTDASTIDYVGVALDTAENEYALDYEKHPNFAYLKELIDSLRAQRDIDDVLTSSHMYKADAAIELFPKALKTKLASGEPVPPATVAHNFLGAFRPNSIEERIKFVDWVFTSYPEFLEDRKLIVLGIRNLKTVSYADTDESERIMLDSEIFKKLTAAKADLDAKEEAEKKKAALAERLYRWNHRLKQFTIL
jgi:hypothetical protein